MHWDDEQFVKIYTRDTGEWTLLSWDAQALLVQILRKVDRSGVLQLGKHGTRVLAATLGHRDQQARILPALAELELDGCVLVRSDCLVVPNFIAAQTSRQSDKARQQSARDRRRAESMGASLPTVAETSQNVTDCHPASPVVTPSHLESPRVTLDKIRLEEKREDQKRPEELIPTTGIASRPVVTVEPQPTRSEARAAENATRAAEKAAEKAAAKIQRDADRAAKQEADRLAKEAKRAAYEQDRADAKAKRTATTKTNGSILFAAYRDAFLRRYGTEPLRDARTGAHFASIAKKTIEGRAAEVSAPDALAEACRVCAAYLQSVIPYYVQQSHPPGLLERDWHKLLTEHRTGKVITPRMAGKSLADIKREADNADFIKNFGRRCDAISVPSAPQRIEPRREED